MHMFTKWYNGKEGRYPVDNKADLFWQHAPDEQKEEANRLWQEVRNDSEAIRSPSDVERETSTEASLLGEAPSLPDEDPPIDAIRTHTHQRHRQAGEKGKDGHNEE